MAASVQMGALAVAVSAYYRVVGAQLGVSNTLPCLEVFTAEIMTA